MKLTIAGNCVKEKDLSCAKMIRDLKGETSLCTPPKINRPFSPSGKKDKVGERHEEEHEISQKCQRRYMCANLQRGTERAKKINDKTCKKVFNQDSVHSEKRSRCK